MKREEFSIYKNHPKRCYVKVNNVRIGNEYKLIKEIPYIDSTVHRNSCNYGQIGDIIVATNTYVDNDCSVLMIAFRTKDSFAGASVPIGMFGYYCKPIKIKHKMNM